MKKPKRHLIIPDTQIKPGVPTVHIDWLANAVIDYLPDVIVVLGDWWDMPSLSAYDPLGSLPMEGARYEDDIAVGNAAFKLLSSTIQKEIDRRKKNHKLRWSPIRHFLFGNHETRIERAIYKDPRFSGTIGDHHLLTPGFTRHRFLERVWIDGIVYSHFFQNQNSHYAIGGSIDNRLNRVGDSFVQGHEQGFKYGNRVYPTGKIRHGLVAGSFYLHDEHYKGLQGNDHWRGIVVLNDVHDGNYDLMPLSIDYLARMYGGLKTWKEAA